MDVLARKRTRATDPLSLSSTKKKPRQTSLISGPYSEEAEGEVAALAQPGPLVSIPIGVPIASFPHHHLLFHLATPGNDDTYQVALNENRWISALSPNLASNWDYPKQPQDVDATTVATETLTITSIIGPDFAPQPARHPVHSGAQVSFPNVALQGEAVVSGGDEGSVAKSDTEKWHAHRPGRLCGHWTMSYNTDAHSHRHSQSQPAALDEHAFPPGSIAACFAEGFTHPGFGVASDIGFEPPVPNYHEHYGHASSPDAESFLSQTELRYQAHQGLWYPGPALAPADAVHHSSPIFPSHIDHLGLVGSYEASSAGNTSLGSIGPSGHQPSPARTESQLQSTRPRRSRGQMQPLEREETSKTRKRKACIRCRMQKIRCIADPYQPDTECCVSCRKVLVLETKKVIHRIPCLRWNLNDVVLFRVGGLGFTKRWAGVCVEDIEARDWVDDRIITIKIRVSKLPCEPMEVRVRRFRPNSTDVQFRFERDQETSEPVVITIPAYALADVNYTSSQYQRYVSENAEKSIQQLATDLTVPTLVRDTFNAALEHARKVSSESFTKEKVNAARLFRNYFRFWVAARFTLGSAYVVDGSEYLEETAPGLSQSGKQFVSRMITAQFDSIGNKYVLPKYKKEVLDDLWATMQKKSQETFFTFYLMVFMMLHEVAVACQDRRRRAKEQGLTTYYDLEEATAQIKHAADNILGHWHYYRGDLDLLNMNASDIEKAFGDQQPGLVHLLMATCQEYKLRKKKAHDNIDWEEDPLNLVLQMLMPKWHPMQFQTTGGESGGK
ncbi:hypothetical protein F5Y17DRAFT_434865 [Xylariaceae sp. FL0594]|nr:hypothetical protein F5Y17DRAFT_434865 [Xylariaceae sp. FL0594]